MVRRTRSAQIITTFSMPAKHWDTLSKIENLCDREKRSLSSLITELLIDWHRKHEESQNPQTKLSLYDQGLASALPNIYELAEHPEKAQRFYQSVKSKEEYKRLDAGLMAMLNNHNKWYRENN